MVVMMHSQSRLVGKGCFVGPRKQQLRGGAQNRIAKTPRATPAPITPEVVSNVLPAVPPSLSAALDDNPVYLLGGIVVAVSLLGTAIVYSQDRAGSSLVKKLMKEADTAEKVWKGMVEEQAKTQTKYEESLDGLNDEWKAVAEARKALEEAEARAREIEESSNEMRKKAEDLQVKSAAAWVDNWKAKTKLEGTLKVGKKK
jgi:hypothetical protein